MWTDWVLEIELGIVILQHSNLSQPSNFQTLTVLFLGS